MLHGVDVSNYQADWSPASGDTFVFLKATEGRTYTSPALAGQTSRARKAGIVVGFYHFMWPGNPEEQAQFFVRQSNPQPGDLLVCDWEKSGTTNEDKDRFIKEVKRLAPHCLTGLYCNTSWWLTIDKTSYYGDFLWIADYRSTSVQTGTPPIRTRWLFWQYSDKPIDQNWCRFESKAELVAWAKSLIPSPPKPPTPPPPPKPKPVKYKEFPFTVTHFNILKPSFADKNDLPWAKRLPLIIKYMKDSHSSVFLLNECGIAEAADVAREMGNSWTWDRLVNNVVLRDKNKWTEVKLIEKYLSGPKTGNRRTLMAVSLRYYQNRNVVVTFGSSHFETFASGFAKNEAQAQALRDKQTQEVVTALGKPKFTIWAADTNDRDVTSGPVAIAKKAGYKLVDDLVRVSGPKWSTDGKHLIDRVFVSPDIKVSSAKRTDPKQASDHLLTTVKVVARIVVP